MAISHVGGWSTCNGISVADYSWLGVLRLVVFLDSRFSCVSSEKSVHDDSLEDPVIESTHRDMDIQGRLLVKQCSGVVIENVGWVTHV